LRRGFVQQPSADAREERGGNFGGDGGVKAGVDGRKKRLFLGEGHATCSACSEVRAQVSLWFSAGGCGFH
jgi:hypothetical protein